MKYQVRYTKGTETTYTVATFNTIKMAYDFINHNAGFGRFSWYQLVEVADNGESRILN